MRNLHNVLIKALELIPDEEKHQEVREKLIKYLNKSMYRAPELMLSLGYWRACQFLLETYLPFDPEKIGELPQWHQRLILLWANK